MRKMEMVYGPVSSWRLGRSFGVDLICSRKKICSFNCNYCQLGREVEKTKKRKNFISINEMKRQVKSALKKVDTDVITFSGLGEPTLAKNLGEAIDEIRSFTNIPLAILTNSSLINDKTVKNDLKKLDIVVAKLDAPNEELFQEINQPAKGISFESVLKGIKDFKKIFAGKLAIQSMFIINNINYAKELAKIVYDIQPDEVQINTPLRPCPIKPLNIKQINRVEQTFKSRKLNTISVYSSKKPKTKAIDKHELLMRRKSVL
jgi:wyosine [tRNA(Phe)-imidazoG37] synthetase (radical SAM superfamily)